MDLLTLGLDPVSPEKPAGTDVRYDPAFEELQAEVDKPPSASGGTDWAKVERLSAEILSRKSKDLLVASYLAVALIYARKTEGAAIGLRIFRDLLETYWETLYPPKGRMRGRLAAIEWWVEKAETALAAIGTPDATPQLASGVRRDFDRIDELLAGYVEDPPSLRPLLEYVRAVESAAQEQAPPPAPAAASAPQPAPAAAQAPPAPPPAPAPAAHPPPAGTVVPDVASKEDVPRVMSILCRKAREVSIFLRNEDLANPLLYRLGRWALWVEIVALPPVEGGRAMVPPPDPLVTATLDGLAAQGNYMELVREAEAALGSSIYWLDLNRISAQALGYLGAPYRAAAEAVCLETAAFVRRLPGLDRMSFSDGKPFADAETRRWLDGILPGAGGEAAQPSAAGGGAGGIEAEVREELARLLPQARQGKADEAAEALQKRIRAGASGKERILWRMALVEALVAGRRQAVALPHVDRLLADLDAYGLEEYDPEVALRILTLAWSASEGREDAAWAAKRAGVGDRLARLDPAAALRLARER